jgi:hypothetical protein
MTHTSDSRQAHKRPAPLPEFDPDGDPDERAALWAAFVRDEARHDEARLDAALDLALVKLLEEIRLSL